MSASLRGSSLMDADGDEDPAEPDLRISLYTTKPYRGGGVYRPPAPTRYRRHTIMTGLSRHNSAIWTRRWLPEIHAASTSRIASN